MTPLERLRLAAALAHTVPAAELRLRTTTDETIVVSAHPSADIDPCALRRVVAAFASSEGPDHSPRIAEVHYGGSLADVGGGIFRVARHGAEQRWIASLLAPERVAEVIGGVGVGVVAPDAVHGCLKPDAGLGVTVLVITVTDDRCVGMLDELATQAASAIFVEELGGPTVGSTRHGESLRAVGGETS